MTRVISHHIPVKGVDDERHQLGNLSLEIEYEYSLFKMFQFRVNCMWFPEFLQLGSNESKPALQISYYLEAEGFDVVITHGQDFFWQSLK